MDLHPPPTAGLRYRYDYLANHTATATEVLTMHRNGALRVLVIVVAVRTVNLPAYEIRVGGRAAT